MYLPSASKNKGYGDHSCKIMSLLQNLQPKAYNLAYTLSAAGLRAFWAAAGDPMHLAALPSAGDRKCKAGPAFIRKIRGAAGWPLTARQTCNKIHLVDEGAQKLSKENFFFSMSSVASFGGSLFTSKRLLNYCFYYDTGCLEVPT